MKTKAFLLLLLFAMPLLSPAQKYLMNEVNGQTISTCSGTFYDSGDSTGNYSNYETFTVTFCSPTGLLYINLTSVAIAVKDYLTIFDGPNTSSPILVTFSGSSGSGTYTSSCGCLTVSFKSGKSTPLAGWRGIIGCNTSNDNIFNAREISLNGEALVMQSNVGATSDFSSGCVTSGNTVWYGFSTTAGNNTVDISLANATFPNVQYLLLYDYLCQPKTANVAATACVTSGTTVQFTALTEGYYWLGITSVVEGTFDLSVLESYKDVCGDFYCGPGESCLNCPFDCGACPEAVGGPYFHPVSGVQNTYLGQCMVGTCEGSYYDDGGDGSQYSENINMIYRTFCPSEGKKAVEATINFLEIEFITTPPLCNDQLWILNGPTQNSDVIWSGCGSSLTKQIISYYSDYAKGIFSSTHPSGCLTFRFNSNATQNGYWEGWDISLTCKPFPAGPDTTYPNDCARATPICDDVTISSQVAGPGLSSEGCGSCVTSENFTEWYKIHVSSGGVMEFEITPLGNSDMDFAIYKADACGEIGDPVRCSYASYMPPGKTGLSKESGDISENVAGDQWVAEMRVEDDDRYYIMINEWDKREPNAYTIDFMLSEGASFDCSEVLPVSFLDFYTRVNEKSIELIWKTASESNNDYFTVERSADAFSFKPLTNIDGAGNSNEVIRYSFTDISPISGIGYYRIKQTDYDGQISYSKLLAVDFLNNAEPWLNIYPNPSAEAIFVTCDATLIDKEYVIINAAGTEVQYGKIEGSHFKLPVTDLEEGAYYFTIDGKTRHSFLVLRPLE